MGKRLNQASAASVCALMAGFAAPAAYAQDQAAGTANTGIQEIVVTAQKRSESINKVPMSVAAVSGEALVRQNVVAVADLQKTVPGFTFSEAPRGSPVFAIRGIGFDDSTIGSASTVALYLDEVPIAFPMEARFPALDLERVEILKGPQGILFGQNSTAGAINFIAAKPTDDFHSGIDLSYSRFNTMQASGFMSGRVSDTLKVRMSVMGLHSDGWQKSITRDDSLGAKRGFAGRFIAEWEPIDSLRVTFNANGWIDKSDTQAAQLLYAFPLQAAFPYVAYNQAPKPPRNARSADWDVYLNTNRLPASVGKQEKLRRDDNFFQVSARIDYDVSDSLVATSITAFSRYNQNFGLDVDGTSLSNFSIGDTGAARSFNQEVRLTGDFDAIKFILGANYSKDKTRESSRYYVDQSSVYQFFLDNLGTGNTDAGSFFNQPIKTYAVFGNIDYKIGDLITLHGGARYTKHKRGYTGCTTDYGDGVQGGLFNTIIQFALNPPGAPAPNIQPGACTSSNIVNDPVIGQYFSPGLAHYTINEDNVSWRAGVDFQVTPTTLLYGNVSKGYKSGGFPAVNVAANIQLEGVKQESVLAYEAGIKAGLFDRRVQMNVAGFYNDYRNKQLRGRILDPFGVFGVLDKLLNIPKSEVYGGEITVQAAPTEGLNINVGASYTKTKVTGDFFAYDPVGNLINYKGLGFPNTPKWNVTAGIDYEHPVSGSLVAFIGANMLYQSKTIGLFARPEEISQADLDPTLQPGVKVPGDAFDKKAYTTVDGQIGVRADDNSWRAWIWGKNIFNTYYWVTATQSFDSIYRLTAMPATYGASVSFRF